MPTLGIAPPLLLSQPAGIEPVRRFLDELDTSHPSATAAPTIDETALDALDTEVRRAGRERRRRTIEATDRLTQRAREDAG